MSEQNDINTNNNNQKILEDKIKKTNIIAMSVISFFMNFASGMIVSSANNFLIGQLNCSQEFLGIVRGGAEGMGNLFKIIFGMLSDYMKNRKLFLMIGYGGMFILKPMFGLTALNYFSQTTRLFIYGFNHALDRILNAMRDGVRDASIYESSAKESTGTFLGLRKFMACLGSCFGGIFSFFMLKKYESNLSATLYAKMYFSTIIPVSFSMIILVFFVKDLFKEKYKNVKEKFLETDYVSPNILLGNMNKINIFTWFLGFMSMVGGLGLVNLLCQWNFNFTTNLSLLENIIKGLSIGIIGALIVEIILVKIYPIFFHKDSNNRIILKGINISLFALIGVLMGQIFLLTLNNSLNFFDMIGAFKLTFFNYGFNGTVIIPFIMIFRWIFYILYLEMQNTLEFYSDKLKKYDKLMILNFILAFSKYSDIFLFQHITSTCHWSLKYGALLFAFLYFVFGVFAYVLGKLSDGFFKKYSIGLLVTVNISFNLITGFFNLLPLEYRYIFGIISLLFYGMYVGFVDSVLVSLVSKSIPVDKLLATLLGLFYLLIGVGNTCAAYFFGSIFKNPVIAYRYALIPSVIAIIFYIYHHKEFSSED